MVRLDEKILDYVRRTGPSTPIEVAQRVGSDSMIVAAILVDAASQHRIKRSKRRVNGSYRYYYFPEQEKALQKRINGVLTPQDKDMIQKILNEKIICELDVAPQEISILSGLEDLIQGFTFEYNNRIVRGWSAPTITEEKAREDILKRLKPVVKEPEAKAEQPKAAPKEPESKKKCTRAGKAKSRAGKGKSRAKTKRTGSKKRKPRGKENRRRP
ncbi:MAG: hypothetical protein ABIF92_03175 [archaeon]